jgi:response regulator RpfG family c-di-GMP phosphodiesterase
MNAVLSESGGSAPAWRILCVDDEPNILASLRRLFRKHGYEVFTAEGGGDGLRVLEQNGIDLVVSDMRMPSMDGAQFLGQVRERWPDTVRILLTGYADMASTVEAINKGEIYRYINKPWDDNDMLMVARHALERKELLREKQRLEALTQRQNEELKSLNAGLELKVEQRTAEIRQVNSFLEAANGRLKTSFLTSVKVFSNLLELRGSHLSGHSRRVADLARKMAVVMGLDARETQDIFLAGLLHDIGKIGFSDDLLSAPVNTLGGDNLGLYRKHAARGEQVLMAIEELRNAAKILRSHHERFDGQGFPDGLAGLAIPAGARILALANDYDALQIGMVMQRRVTQEDAKAAIVQGKGKRYDPQAVDAFVQVTGGVEKEVPVECVVTAAELKPGMVLTRDLITRDGVLLLASDYILDPGLIRQIQDYAASEGVALSVHIRSERRNI